MHALPVSWQASGTLQATYDTSIPLFLPLSSLSVCMSVCLSLSMWCISLWLCLSLSVSVSLSLSLSLSQSLGSVSLSIHVSVFAFVSVSVCLSVPLSLLQSSVSLFSNRWSVAALMGHRLSGSEYQNRNTNMEWRKTTR